MHQVQQFFALGAGVRSARLSWVVAAVAEADVFSIQDQARQ